MRYLLFVTVVLWYSALSAQTFPTPYEQSQRTRTATYDECANWYRMVNRAFPEVTYFDSIGPGDIGKQIYVFRIYNSSNQPKIKVLINNNIHPGEPEGTDASMLLVRDILTRQDDYADVLKQIDLHIICQYNVDGTINRSCCTRANQNGPAELGFRGNARNLDLNRDFVKTDSRNARAFVKYFTKKQFHFFIDNHTSDGADYQYVLTYFHTRPEKLDSGLANWMLKFNPGFVANLEKAGYPAAPYVETLKHIPDSGIYGFWESGRYATGFAALHHCIGYTVETHMLKPFDKRVDATLVFMRQFLVDIATNQQVISVFQGLQKRRDFNRLATDRKEVTDYQLLMQHPDSIWFLGFESSYKKSTVTGMDRLYFDSNKPWKRKIAYYHSYRGTDSVNMPKYYFIPWAWGDIADKLQLNNINVKRCPYDTFMPLRVSYIVDYASAKTPYEGHFLHHGTKTRDTVLKVQVRKGDYLVQVSEWNRKFLAAVLEPRSPDSYFNWNLFDAILQQKEWYSDYVWIDKCEAILNENPALKKEFDLKKSTDATFAKDAWQQMTWIYRHSDYYEKTHNLYPVFRLD